MQSGLASNMQFPASAFQALKYQGFTTTTTWKFHFKSNVITTIALLACIMSSST